MREPGQGDADESADGSLVEADAGVLRFARAVFHPACAAADAVGGVEIFGGEGLARAQQLDDGFSELHAGGPGLVHTGVGEEIGGAGALADAGETVAIKERLAVAAGLFQRFSAPGAQGAVLEIAPQRGMLDEVLQIAIGGARGIVHPRRNDDADGDETIRMRIEKAEDLRLGIAEGVPDGAGLEDGLGGLAGWGGRRVR